MSAADLATALAALGVECTVTAEASVALVQVPAHVRALERASVRREAVRLASTYGFRSLALEVLD